MSVEMPLILSLSFFLVLIGLWGIFRHQKDLMRVLLALQLIFLATLLNFSLGSSVFENASGLIFSLFVVCLTGVQIVTALTLFLLYFKKHAHLHPDRVDETAGEL